MNQRAIYSTVSFLLLAMTMATIATAQLTTISMQQQHSIDLTHRDRDIHWPAGADPATAAQFSHNDLLIHASCTHVFKRMAKVTDWPTWFILVKNVSVQGPSQTLGLGAILGLSIFDTPITARITEWVPDERISWLPQTVSPSEASHYHAWHFVPAPEGCKVVTEEVGTGPADKKMGPEGSFYMHRAHDLWLASLRYTSE